MYYFTACRGFVLFCFLYKHSVQVGMHIIFLQTETASRKGKSQTVT